jgi:hypothetical protein
MAEKIRAAVFSGETPIKFISGEARQLNANMTNSHLDWRPVDATVVEVASVPSRGSLPNHPDKILSEIDP